jgi:hypothetical protein
VAEDVALQKVGQQAMLEESAMLTHHHDDFYTIPQ